MFEGDSSSALSLVFSVEAAGMTTCGPTRAENQDAIVLNGQVAQKSDTFLSEKVNLGDSFSAVVVDGMGGYCCKAWRADGGITR